MKGREGAGILDEGEAADRVRRAIEEGLTGIRIVFPGIRPSAAFFEERNSIPGHMLTNLRIC